MRELQMDLTKYLKKDILYNDLGFSTGKSTNDLINEMQAQGLLVDFLEITGEIIRVPVKAIGGKPDTGGQKSGYYAINQVGGHMFCTYGNWKTGFEGKWSSIDTNQLSIVDRQELQKQMEEASAKSRKVRQQKQDEVAVEVQERFKICHEAVDHEYLTNKKVKSYGLKQLNGRLIVPVYSTTGQLRSLQYIDKKGEKRFASASEIKGNVFLIGTTLTELPNIEKLILVEGYSTAATVYEATQIPVACVFSANFLWDAASKLRALTGARFILALDNDESGVGEKKAQECASAVVNCAVRLPSEIGDFNDLYLRHGLDKVKAELVEHKLGIQKYAVRNLVGKPEPQKFLVEGLIPIGKPGILAAVGGVGKSLSVIQLALAVACGGRWWGKDVKERGNVTIFAAEDDLAEIHRRLDLLDPQGRRFNSEYEVFILPVPEQKEPMILLKEEGITPIGTELVEELQAIPNLKLVCFDPLQAFTTGNVSSSNEVGQLWGSYCANISARLGCSTITVHHLNKGALTNDSDDAMSHRQEIRGASSILDSCRWGIALWLASVEDCERICEEQRVKYDRMTVVKAALVKSNSGNVDYSTKTLFRKNGVLEPLEELQNPMTLYDQF
jgi:phage/plasmid primase-like uncharacterized protein